MMAWETLDDCTIDKAEEENENADETKFEDAEDADFNFLVGKLKLQEIILGGLISLKTMQSQNKDEDSDDSSLTDYVHLECKQIQ